MSVAIVAHKEAKESSAPQSGGYYAFSSLAYSFAALMLMMEAALKVSNEMAKDAQESVVAEGHLATHVADQTRTAGDADSTNMEMQAGESIADGFASAISAGATLGQIRGVSDATDAFNNQDHISEELNVPGLKLKGEPVVGEGGAALPAEDTAALARLRGDLRAGRFFAGERATKVKSIHENIPGEKFSLKQVLQSADPATDEFAKLEEALGQARQTAATRLNAEQQNAQQRSQMYTAFGQLFTSGAKSGLKFKEADATQEKAYANAAESVFNVQEQLIKATKDTQQQQSDAFYKTEQDALTTIATIAQVDARA